MLVSVENYTILSVCVCVCVCVITKNFCLLHIQSNTTMHYLQYNYTVIPRCSYSSLKVGVKNSLRVCLGIGF